MATESRYFSGYAITGQHMEISVQPSDDGRISVGIVALNAGSDGRAALMGSEGFAPYFLPEEIALTPESLTCLARARSWGKETPLGFFREGIAVDLEPGMSKPLVTALERVTRVTRRHQTLANQVELLLTQGQGTFYSNDMGLAKEVLAAVMLDGATPQAAADRCFTRYAQGDSSGRLSEKMAAYKELLLVCLDQDADPAARRTA